MQQYLDLLQDIMTNGVDKGDRTGTGTRSVFGRQLRFDLNEGFPLLTTKKVFFKGIKHELLWMLSGSSNVRPLQEAGVRIWDEWADENGELGPVYGYQWRHWPTQELDDGDITTDFNGDLVVPFKTVDQIKNVVERIKTNPDCRRLIVSAWNPADVPQMALPPCHCLFQFYVADGRLSCQLYQRSCDVFLGVPFNIASYALLTHMIAQVCGLGVGEFIHTYGDLHIYNNHRDAVFQQLNRKPRKPPTLCLNPEIKDIFEFTPRDINLGGYDPHPPIKADVSV